MKKLIIFFFSILCLLSQLSCDNKQKSNIMFSYKAILDKEFKFKEGKIIPITIEQAVEIDGAISTDGNYFYYASNRSNGNYDIYLRLLTDITTVRLTDHPSKDTSPVISPDGRHLAFVSQREDPEGDIYVIKLNPKKIIDQAKESISEMPTLDKEAKNLTQYQDPQSKTIRIVKDASPIWSPDGKLIAFSSARDGKENIWIMDQKGKNMQKITIKGGVYPKFSPDGNNIIFISYRDKGSKGEIYTINVKTKKETKITQSDSIKLYPSYMGNADEIIYSLIDRDTNGDKVIDIKDNSILYYKNLKTKIEYPLTLYSQNSFKASWFPMFNAPKGDPGLIVFLDQVNQNININMIPETGIIPKRNNAFVQYNMLKNYLTIHNDTESYQDALEKVYFYFQNQNDNISKIYVTKALFEAITTYKEEQRWKDVQRMMLYLQNYAKRKNKYAEIIFNYVKSITQGRNGVSSLVKAISLLSQDKKDKYLSPYLLEDLADSYAASGNYVNAISTYKQIIDEFSAYEKLKTEIAKLKNEKKSSEANKLQKDLAIQYNHLESYKRIYDVHEKYARLSYNKLTAELNASIIEVMYKGQTNQIINMTKHLLQVFDKTPAPKRLNLLLAIENKYQDISYKMIKPTIYFSVGKTYLDLKNFSKASGYFAKALKSAPKSDIIYYKANIKLAELAIMDKKYKDAEQFTSTAVNNYRLIWQEKDIRSKILWLIDYYNKYGKIADSSRNFKDAVFLYERYTMLMSFIHLLKRYEDIYNEYGARSHVLFIDSYLDWKGKNKILELENKYIQKLPIARNDFDKAFIYGVGYLYTLKAVISEKTKNLIGINIKGETGTEGLLINFRRAIQQIEWALFIDDTFIDPYLLKSWIYQYVDVRRKYQPENDNLISKYFPLYLWEKNIALLERALDANDEARYKENEGNIHLNIANNYFLLLNFPRALHHYELAHKFKKNFSSKLIEAQFYFHKGYAHWQNGENKNALNGFSNALAIYESFATGKDRKKYAKQLHILYKYFAMLNRFENNYDQAIHWYNKTINFSKKYKLKFDNARFLQEIAYCHKQLGKYDTALAYLRNAEKLLQNYKDKKKTYKMQWTFFGIGPIKFFDLGPDQAVIGENKIFTDLDTRSKRLLNISMQEEIFLARRNYEKAISFLKKKIDIIKERDNQADKEAMSKTLNNLGYYYFKSGNYTSAIDYFKKAWDYASSKDVNDLQGSFTAIMNISNLYAFLIDNDSPLFTTPSTKIDELAAKIMQYRQSYEIEKFKKELKKMEDEAKAKKRVLTEADKENKKKEIAEGAKEIYYSIDIAASVLKFYKAEFLMHKEFKLKKTTVNEAYKIYQQNKNIFNLYLEALKTFQYALDIAEKSKRKEMEIKLLLNIAICYSRIQAPDMAYGTFLSALEKADKIKVPQLQLNAYYRLGKFLLTNGKGIEANFMTLADNYLRRAIDLVENNTLLFSDNINKIQDVYNTYITRLIQARQWHQALIFSEKKYETLRVMLVNSSSPELANETDKLKYEEYTPMISQLHALHAELSSLLISGEPENSEKVKVIQAKLGTLNRDLQKFLQGLEPNSLFKSFLVQNKPVIPVYQDRSIYAFFTNGDAYIGLKIFNGAITAKNLGNKEIIKSISLLLLEDKNKKYIILNNTFLNIVKNEKISPNSFPPFMFSPSLSRIKYYSQGEAIALGKTFFNGNGLKDIVQTKPMLIIEGNTDLKKLENIPIIIDIKNEIAVPSVLFNNRVMQPALLVANLAELDLHQVILLTEASLYAHIRTIAFTQNANNADFSRIISVAKEKDFTYLQRGVEFNNPIITIGYSGLQQKERKESLAAQAGKEYKSYEKYVRERKFDLAKVHLLRWHDLNKSKQNMLYYSELIKLYILLEQYDQALVETNNTLHIIGQSGQDKTAKFAAFQIFILLQQGNLKQAFSAIDKNEKSLSGYKDFHIFNAIKILATKKTEISWQEFMKYIDKNANLLNTNRLLLLYAEFLHVYNQDQKIATAMLKWSDNYVLSDREILKSLILKSYSYKPYSLNNRMRSILKLKKDTPTKHDMSDVNKIKNEATLLAKDQQRFDTLSPFVVIFTLHYLKNTETLNNILLFLKDIDINSMIRNVHWLDALMLYKQIITIYSLEPGNKSSIDLVNSIVATIAKKPMQTLLIQMYHKKAIELAMQGLLQDAYKLLLENEKLTNKDIPLYNDYQLLMLEIEVSINKNEIAAKRASALAASALTVIDKYILKLIEAKIELNRLATLKKATAQDAQVFEKIFKSALLILEKNPGILSSIKRVKLVNNVFSDYINYKMRTGKQIDALVFAELKRFIMFNTRISGLRFKLFNTLPFEKILNNIPNDSVIIYSAHFGNDIFTWFLGKKDNKNFIKSAIINNGYSKIAPLIKKYNEHTYALTNTRSLSKDFYNLFIQYYQYLNNKKKIIFITDNQLEKIPFEIMGNKERLEETHAIFYMPSLFSILQHPSGSKNFNVHIIGQDDNKIYNYLEKIAIKESGVRINASSNIKSGIGHVQSEVSYNNMEKVFYLGAKQYSAEIKNTHYLYFPSIELANIGNNDFVLLNSIHKITGMVLNNANKHDINNAIFVDNFYTNLQKKMDILKAFEMAKAAIRKNKQYNHPAYWAGIRLYLNKNAFIQ